MLSVNPYRPTTGREKGGNRRETYKLEIKIALLITLITLIILIIREMRKVYKTDTEFPRAGCRRAGIPPAAARQHQEVPDWPQQQTGTGLRNAQIRIWIRITGRTRSRVLFRSLP